MRNSIKDLLRTPLTKSQKRPLLLILVTLVNAIMLIHNFTLHTANDKILQTVQAYHAQIDYATDCQLITKFIPELSPPPIRFQDTSGAEHLYYCTHITVERSHFDDSDPHTWHVVKNSEKYETERVDLPDYTDCLDQIFYHSYSYSSYDGPQPRLETHQIRQLGDTYYIVECDYDCMPSTVDIDDPDAVTDFLLQQDSPRFTLYFIPLPQPNSTQIQHIRNNNPNIIYNSSENSTCTCNYSNTGTNCKCTKCQPTG